MLDKSREPQSAKNAVRGWISVVQDGAGPGQRIFVTKRVVGAVQSFFAVASGAGESYPPARIGGLKAIDLVVELKA